MVDADNALSALTALHLVEITVVFMRTRGTGLCRTVSVHIDAILFALTLMGAAAVAGWISSSTKGGPRPVRLTSSFAIAAALALPPPFALVVALAGLAVSRDPLLPGLVAAAALQVGALEVGSLPPLAGATILYGSMVLAVLAVDAVSGARRSPGAREGFEVSNVVAAMVLAAPIRADDAWSFAYAVLAVLGAAYALSSWARDHRRADEAQGALATRVAEISTIHAIGREIQATLDPERIFAIVERECRKIFEIDFLFIGVVDRDTSEIHITYRGSSRASPKETLRPVGDDLASWIVREKRPLRIDDASAASGLPFRPHKIDAAVRSVLAVPLLVAERVVGVLSVQSRRPAAYEDHQLSVLATIAQQAAVALENARNYRLATVDSLTGLHLRDDFFGRFEEEYARAKRYAGAFSLLMIDLDGFKEINDRQGHLAGDRYLRALGAAIRARMRGADIACRYGGDEFCVLLPETDLAGARLIAERLRRDLASLVVDVDGATLRTTVSIGIASYPEHDAGDVKRLLLRADQALYQAKRAGRDRVVPFAA